jgi:predicted enzyme related to lactoylglutathione lyase
MANAFCHLELATTDLAKAKAFYSGLFSWALEDMDMGPGGTYTIIKPGEGPGGGMMKHPIPGAPSAWLAYVQVDDLAASTAKAKSLGAQVMKDITEVPHMGHFSILLDPTGAAIALWQPAPKS